MNSDGSEMGNSGGNSRTEVRSPTRTEVRSPTRTSTWANTRGNFTSTVTGGAGAGATEVTINIPGNETEGLDPYDDDTSGFFSSLAKGIAKVAKVAALPITAPVKLTSKVLGKVPVLGGVVKAVNRVALMPINVTQQVLEGGNVNKVVLGNLKQALKDIKTVGPWAQTVLSFVPGVGTGMAAAIGAGLALAEGKSISQAMVAAVKGSLPGGAASQAAFNVAEAAIQGKPIDQIAISALPISAQQKQLLAQGLAAAKDIAAGKNVAASIADRAIKTLPAQYAKAVQIGLAVGRAKSLQQGLKTGVMGAASMGVSTLSKGKTMNPFIKAVSNLGTSKGAIQKAVGAAQAIKNGSPVLGKALNSAVKNFRQGSPEHLGFATAVNVLKQTAGNKVAMGVARRALPTQSAQRAFDAAVGTVARTVAANPAALAKRAGSTFVPQMSRKKGTISPYQPNLKHAIDSLKRNPTLAAQHPMVLAKKFGTSQQVAMQALKKVGTQRLLPWRSMSPRAAAFVQKWSKAPLSFLSHGTGDTAGLDESGTKYIVEKGDSPFKIALKLTGNGNRWTELKALNTDKKPAITVNIWTGEVLNIPASWQKPVVKEAAPPVAVLSQPTPTSPVLLSTPAPQISVAPGILQAKATLVAWGKTDGVNQAGVADYGSSAADLSTDFGPRDSLQLMAFQNWANKTLSAGLSADGKLDPKSLSALQSWAETRAAAAVSSPGKVTTLPEIIIEGTVPEPGFVKGPFSVPGVQTLPPAAAPIPVSAPAPVVAIALPTPAPVAAAIPAVATPAQPATPATVAAATPAKPGSKMGPALAGAAVGGTLFGLPGAIIGGIAGAAIA
jgi:hypothetical protein